MNVLVQVQQTRTFHIFQRRKSRSLTNANIRGNPESVPFLFVFRKCKNIVSTVRWVLRENATTRNQFELFNSSQVGRRTGTARFYNEDTNSESSGVFFPSAKCIVTHMLRRLKPQDAYVEK